MREVVFQYKCRMCGNVFSADYTCPKSAGLYLLRAAFGHSLPKELDGFKPKLLHEHTNCWGSEVDEENCGVGDLIGYIVKGKLL